MDYKFCVSYFKEYIHSDEDKQYLEDEYVGKCFCSIQEVADYVAEILEMHNYWNHPSYEVYDLQIFSLSPISNEDIVLYEQLKDKAAEKAKKEQTCWKLLLQYLSAIQEKDRQLFKLNDVFGRYQSNWTRSAKKEYKDKIAVLEAEIAEMKAKIKTNYDGISAEKKDDIQMRWWGKNEMKYIREAKNGN